MYHSSTAVMDAQQKRETRLSRRRERERRLRASESAEQRETRLAKRRVSDRAQRAAQSTVQRERALHITIIILVMAIVQHCIRVMAINLQ